VVAALGNLDAGTNATVTIVARPISTGPIDNFATVRSNEPDPNSINNSATAYAFAIPAPTTDVAVAITAAPQPATVGQPFAYAVLVGNPGTAPASGVVLTDVLPDAATVASIKPSQGTYTLVGNVLTVNFGSLAVGALAEVTVSLIPGAPGVIINRASVVSDQPDFHIANNFDALATGVVGQPIAPAIVDQKLTVVGNKITRAILAFNEALDSNSAAMIANYLVEDLGSNGSTSAKGPKVPILSATYDAASRSVTLVFGKPLSLGRFYKIVVNEPGSPGLVDPAGNVLDGERNGLQNGIYTSLDRPGDHDPPDLAPGRRAEAQAGPARGPRRQASSPLIGRGIRPRPRPGRPELRSGRRAGGGREWSSNARRRGGTASDGAGRPPRRPRPSRPPSPPPCGGSGRAAHDKPRPRERPRSPGRRPRRRGLAHPPPRPPRRPRRTESCRRPSRSRP